MDETQRTRIPRVHWPDFCQVFSQRHRGWQVEVSKVWASGESSAIAPAAPLDEVKVGAEPAGQQSNGSNAGPEELIVSLAATRDLQPTIVAIQRPQSLSTLQVPNGPHAGLRIETPDDIVVELRF